MVFHLLYVFHSYLSFISANQNQNIQQAVQNSEVEESIPDDVKNTYVFLSCVVSSYFSIRIYARDVYGLTMPPYICYFT